METENTFKNYFYENVRIYDKYSVDPDRKAKLFHIWVTISDIQDINQMYNIKDNMIDQVEFSLDNMRKKNLFDRKDHYMDPLLLSNIKTLLIKYKGLLTMKNIDLTNNRLYKKDVMLEEINKAIEYVQAFLDSTAQSIQSKT